MVWGAVLYLPLGRAKESALGGVIQCLSASAVGARAGGTRVPRSPVYHEQTYADLPVISSLSERILSAHTLEPEMAQAFSELFQAVRDDLKPVPGTGAILDAFAERFAFLHLWLKTRDISESRLGGGLGPLQDYERISNLHIRYGVAMLRHVASAPIDESMKKAIAYQVVQGVLAAIDSSDVIPGDDKLGLKMTLARELEGSVL